MRGSTQLGRDGGISGDISWQGSRWPGQPPARRGGRQPGRDGGPQSCSQQTGMVASERLPITQARGFPRRQPRIQQRPRRPPPRRQARLHLRHHGAEGQDGGVCGGGQSGMARVIQRRPPLGEGTTCSRRQPVGGKGGGVLGSRRMGRGDSFRGASQREGMGSSLGGGMLGRAAC
jgi:hypothetical protein